MANRRFAPASRKRRMSWEGGNVDIADLTTVSPLAVTVLTEAQLENFPTPTLIRSRGRINAYTDPSATPGSFAVVGVGLIVVTAAAAAVGVTAIPTPLTELGSDWLWWDSLSVGSDAADVIGSTITVDRLSVDSKAMRKIGNNQVVLLVAEMLTCEGTMVVNLCGTLRFLLKAP